MQPNRLKLFLLFILLIIVILEILLRLTGVRSIPPNACRKYDPLLYSSFIPNTVCQSKTTEWDITYKINSQGRRDFEYTLVKPNNTYRILMLGDSFIEGFGVPLEKSYPKILEKNLNDNSSKKIEIISAGIAGWSTISEYFYLYNEGLKYQPDLVILNLNITDFTDNRYFYNHLTAYGQSILDKNLTDQIITQPVFTLPPKQTVNQKDYVLRLKIWLDENSAVYNLSRKKVKSLLLPKNNPVNIDDTQREMFALTYPTKPDNYSEILGTTENIILKMKQLLLKNNTDFLLVFVPHGHMVSASEWLKGRSLWNLQPKIQYSDWVFTDLTGWAKKENILTYNLTPFLRLAADNRQLYFPYDGHFNNDGQYAVAQALFAYFKDKVR